MDDTSTDDTRTLSAFALLCRLDVRWREASQLGAAGTSTWSGLGVRVGDHRLVIPRDDVSEVIARDTLTRIPGGRAWMRGLANHRGALLPVFDLGALLGIAPPDTRAWTLHLNHIDLPAGFSVDEVHGHREFVAADQRPELMAQVPASAQDGLLGVFVRDGETWWVISLHKLVASPAFRVGAQAA